MAFPAGLRSRPTRRRWLATPRYARKPDWSRSSNPKSSWTASIPWSGAANTDPQSDEAQPSDGERGGVERAAAEEAAGDHGASHGSDSQGRSRRSGPRKRDRKGQEGGSGCGDHRRRRGLAGRDDGIIAKAL